MPAGLNHMGQMVFVSCSRQNKVKQYQWKEEQLIDRGTLCRMRGPDNIRFEGESLLVAAHLKTTKFIQHIAQSESPSPTTLYKANPASGTKKIIFQDTGQIISAGSVGVFLKDHYYIGQIFDPGIARIQK